MSDETLPDHDLSGEDTEAMLRAGNSSQRKRTSSADITKNDNKTKGNSRNDEPTYTNICTAICGEPSNPRMIKCDHCNRFTHFECTELPGYQLQQLMTKGYRKYLCPQCFGEVDELYTESLMAKKEAPIYSVPCRNAEMQTELPITDIGVQTDPIAVIVDTETQGKSEEIIAKMTNNTRDTIMNYGIK